MYFKIVRELKKKYSKNVILYLEDKVEICSFISEENKLLLGKVIEEKKFRGKMGETLETSFIQYGNLINMILVGVGKEKEATRDSIIKALYKALVGSSGEVIVSSEEEKLKNIDAIAEATYHINYKFDRYKTKEIEREPLIIEYFDPEAGGSIVEGEILGKAINIARDLVNEPANVIYPKTLAMEAATIGSEYGFDVEIFEEYEIGEIGMEALLAVARAAEKRPRLIVMRYFGDKKNPDKITGLVGKGLTYDTGGLSLKPTDSMLEMKSDMGGAATVIGAMSAASKMKLEKNIVGVIAACENSIGGNAYRPGDVIGSMAGKTIEITNTDAEGRLTLADAVTYIIRKEKVSEVIDIATLTGGIVVALGTTVTGVFSNNDSMYSKLEKSGEVYGEKLWRMPLFDDYKELIKSDIADLKNSGGRWGSAPSAAKFIEEFSEGIPWMHIDIAGTAFLSGAKDYFSKGATGNMVRSIYGYLKAK
ncbi:leucyl aminopeptidase [uncultured Ilyobacter sp.]|uniref:leucyl aminopeptidase n=1 Tax=uncultured Ilyobacter sp. TaxID=544433 RepID=UPI0029C98C30|nr:leucyl aminopeptidase [uncultured Ilyobacter sp.]